MGGGRGCRRASPDACFLQCFMNAILQCLSNTRELRDYCLQRLYLRDLGHSSHAHTALMDGEPVRIARSPGHLSAPLLLP